MRISLFTLIIALLAACESRDCVRSHRGMCGGGFEYIVIDQMFIPIMLDEYECDICDEVKR